MSGPLKGLKVIEFGGIGPGPFCAMMLADMGADVIRLDRKADKGKDRGSPGFLASGRRSVLHRGRRSVAVDLKDPGHRDQVLAMIDGADAVIEGYRPGVLERLGFGPDVLLARNPRLVIGRMTGWGQDGPLAQSAGHDINYIALSGALATIGRKEGGPVAPAAMVGDLGGGGMMLAFGIVCAVLEARASGQGQVVDAAVLDAYGWSDLVGNGATDETLLERLVALNRERTSEEAQGQIRWLRPEYQHPAGKPANAGAANALAEEADQDAATGDDTTKVASTAATPRDPWPASLPEQVAAVARVLAASSAPLTLADLAARFTGKGPWKKRLPQIIDTLEALGRARRDVEGRVVG